LQTVESIYNTQNAVVALLLSQLWHYVSSTGCL